MRICYLIILIVLCFYPLKAQDNVIEVPIRLQDDLGKGIGAYAMNSLQFVDWETYIWKELIPKPKGLPDDWKAIRLGIEFLNQPQFIYQYTKSGQIAEGYMQEEWLKNGQFTEAFMRCYLLFADGTDRDGNRWFVIDQNNNQDLSDDTIFCADSMAFEKGRKEARIVYDVYLNGEVVQQERTLYIGYDSGHQMYFGKIAEYAVCNLNGVPYMLSPHGHNYLRYENFEVIPLEDDSQKELVPSAEQPARRGDYIQIENDWYCFNSVDIDRQVAILNKDSRSSSEIFAMQTGFRVYPFSGSEFSSKDSLSPDRYKGKNLLLMVWSPGCGSCIDKLAPMNEIYASVDPLKVELLGLALHTDTGFLSSVKEEHAIAFPLMIGEHGQMNEAYIRLNTPSFILINPEGIITMKTLNLDEVKDAVLRL